MNLLLIFIITAILSFAMPNCYAYELPDLGRPGAKIFTTKEEQKLGKKFMQEVRHTMPILTDAIVSDYIQKLGQRLIANSSLAKNQGNKKFHFFVVQDPSINAFAGPSGYIGINSGLILATTTENDLAAVLSHEIAHVAQHHLERSFEQVHNLNIPMAAAMIAALALGGGSAVSSEASSIATGAALSVAAGGTQHMINFTRANEAEADSVGMEILHKANFDSKAMPSFFSRMQKLALDYGEQLPPYLKTHPVTSDRIAEAENRAARYHQKLQIPSSNHYFLARARLQYMLLQNDLGAANYFKTYLAHNNNNAVSDIDLVKQQNAKQYAYVLALIKNHELQTANNNIDELIKKNPHEVIYQMAKAQIQAKMGTTNAAVSLEILKHAYSINPSYYPLALQYSATLTKARQFETANNILKQQLAKNNTDDHQVVIYATLANNSALSGNLANAYFYRAKALEILTAYKKARILLQQALQLPNLGTNMKASLQAELFLVKESLAKQKDMP